LDKAGALVDSMHEAICRTQVFCALRPLDGGTESIVVEKAASFQHGQLSPGTVGLGQLPLFRTAASSAGLAAGRFLLAGFGC
jgi:hypothetical protein